jgi:homoserine dehydrogenase
VSENAGGPTSEPLRLLGCGVVGSSVARLLTATAADLAARVGRPLEIVGVAVRRTGRDRSDTGLPAEAFTADAEALVERADIVVEVIGGIEPARGLILRAMEHGASVVTANKALLAEDGPTLYAAARQHGVDLYYEAAVAGAIPLLRPLRESLAGDDVRRVLGIVNGTTNYVLDKMDRHRRRVRRGRRRRRRWATPRPTRPPTSRASTPPPRPPSSRASRSTRG